MHERDSLHMTVDENYHSIYKKKIYGMIVNKTTLHKRPNDIKLTTIGQ